ncbi:chromatin-remodeling complex subunit ies6 [Thoreauomyces humboldtii]|nr:chromatin-remodeling complex subunit ies6 [Thoreauomyces humboldtii]
MKPVAASSHDYQHRNRMGAGQKRTRQRPSPPSKRAKFEASQDGGPHTPTPSSPITTPSGVAKADVIAELSLVTASKPFKNPAYNAPKAVKKLKQIAALEKGLDVPPDFPTYWNIEAMPSFRPQKKYCDITGLECRETQAPYTDPKTGLRYHNSDVYQYIRTFQPQHVQAYLELRNAAVKL